MDNMEERQVEMWNDMENNGRKISWIVKCNNTDGHPFLSTIVSITSSNIAHFIPDQPIQTTLKPFLSRHKWWPVGRWMICS
jgi:hypothetical protein